MPSDPAFKWLLKKRAGATLVRLLPIPYPEIVDGNDATGKIAGVLQDRGAKKPLIVTDNILLKLGALQTCVDSLQAIGMDYEMFAEVEPNPTDELCVRGYQAFKSAGCDCIVAFGGGSPMDCAKAIGSLAARPNDSIKQLEGGLKVSAFGLRGIVPLLVAVPTTAGTGSEVTIGAVITLAAEQRKALIGDPALTPKVVFLDPSILLKLPPSITAATGMDALTHAMEAYLGGWRSAYSGKHSLRAIEKILGGRNLLKSYQDATNMAARSAMLQAALEAGVAITNAQIGYVHAVAHQFGALFHVPHGEANAMILPHILDFFLRGEPEGSAIIDRCAEMAQAAGLMSHYSEGTPAEKAAAAAALVEEVRRHLIAMSMKTVVEKMKASDVSMIAKRALNEAHGEGSDPLDLGYPVPKYMSLQECEELVAKFLTPEERDTWAQRRSRPPQSRL